MKIGIVGCAGRMGRTLVQTVCAAEGVDLAGGLEASGHPAIGEDVCAQAGCAPLGVPVSADADTLFAAADAIIDFTVQAAAKCNAGLAARHGVAFIIGTTGLNADDQAAIAAASERVPVVQAANMSIGVNLLLGLTRQVAAVLGEEYDIEIVEMHHRHKVDAPSGTARALGDAAAAGRGQALDAVAKRVRDGNIGSRKSGEIGFATLRGGDVVGEHTVLFAGAGERIEITHRATSRSVFATGAVRAARWASGRPPGLYTMHDVLGLATGGS